MPEYDYYIAGEDASKEEEIGEIKLLVAEEKLSEAEINSLFQEKKTDIFKGIFTRPKDEEVVIENITKSFEPFMIIGGAYELRYLTENTYDIPLLDETESVMILGQEIIVEEENEEEEEENEEEGEEKEEEEEKMGFFESLFSSGQQTKSAKKTEIQLKGIEHVHIQRNIREARNYQNRYVDPDSLAKADFQEVGEAFLKNQAKMVSEDQINMTAFTAEIIEEYSQKPENVQRVLYERLELQDRKIILYPVYWAELVYKGSKRKKVRLEPITEEVEERKGTRFAPLPEISVSIASSSTTIPEQIPSEGSEVPEVAEPTPPHSSTQSKKYCPNCGTILEREAVFCSNCGVKVK
ncbi:MAG: zinc-ribbon domain-containing protein [Candidatus Heimdallarchaeota archaeon]|nr:zinc-ribbon domain-containing protein [Candidatus Heimdallarchaeota archaeon]